MLDLGDVERPSVWFLKHDKCVQCHDKISAVWFRRSTETCFTETCFTETCITKTCIAMAAQTKMPWPTIVFLHRNSSTSMADRQPRLHYR